MSALRRLPSTLRGLACALALPALSSACVGSGASADYNANGIEDVDEAQGMDLGPNASIHVPFIPFTYFVELYRGYYENGVYVIEEKSRALDADVPSKPFGGDEEFNFSPDGKLLAYVSRNGAGRFQLSVMDLANRQVTVVTDTQRDESPSFAPN